jgi:UDP-N-acetylglucosamine 2-epimerase (non-hydrolysing)
MKIVIVVGARPNFMKAAPIIAAIRRHNQDITRVHAEPTAPDSDQLVDYLLVHTGQHYDAAMSDAFFSDLNLPAPDIHLGVGSAPAAVQTAEIIKQFEDVLLRERPDIVVLVGDVTSTLACAISTAKIAFDLTGTRPLLAHVEAGLRSFDRSMPEEVNRVVTDHLSDLFFVTEESGLRNLRNEGLPAGGVHFVGNTMIDSLLAYKDQADSSAILQKLGLRTRADSDGSSSAVSRYALLTLHRPANVDNREVFTEILSGLGELGEHCPIVFPVHPRTQQRIREFGVDLQKSRIVPTEPLGYLDFLCLMKHATLVATDSGGIQEETTCLGVPCVTVRENTERPVTVESGTNIIAGTTGDGIKSAIRRQLQRKDCPPLPKNWDGQAAARIVGILVRACDGRKHPEAAWARLHQPVGV